MRRSIIEIMWLVVLAAGVVLSPSGVYAHFSDYGGNSTIETRKDSSTNPFEQYVMDISYIHSPVLRFRDSDTDGANIETLYYTFDSNFNVTALVDSTAAVVERYTYDPYGKVQVFGGSWAYIGASAYGNYILYTCHKLDVENEIYYSVNRYYYPTLARWINRDPIGYNNKSLTLYQYVKSNPIMYYDPVGFEEGGIVKFPTDKTIMQKKMADEMQAVYEMMLKICEKDNCIKQANGGKDKGACTKDDCVKEAADIAKRYVNRFYAVAKPYEKTVTDRHWGWVCFQWAQLILRDLGQWPKDYKSKNNRGPCCWKVTMTGTFVPNWKPDAPANDPHKDLWHYYAYFSLGDIADPKAGPIKECGIILDPSPSFSPQSYSASDKNLNDWNNWNWYLESAIKAEDKTTVLYSIRWWDSKANSWKTITGLKAPSGNPEDPTHEGARYPDGTQYKPPSPLVNWEPNSQKPPSSRKP